MDSKHHWEHVYHSKATESVSWFQEHAALSLDLIRGTGVGLDASIIDVGSGASRLIDDLLDHGYRRITALDLSDAALAATRARVGDKGRDMVWIADDITRIELPRHAYDVWHDRAVFHFLTTRAARIAYVNAVLRAVRPGGHVIVATFDEDGPTQCSGLPVMRYSANELHGEFGAPFKLLRSERELHDTPFGTQQKFIYCYCRKQTN